jgi:Interferon-induced transmembrane protein
MSGSMRVRPPTYLAGAILSTLFCCLPFGIVSIVFAAQVDAKYNGGDYAGADESSDRAKNWMIASIVAGLVWTLLGLLVTGGFVWFEILD